MRDIDSYVPETVVILMAALFYRLAGRKAMAKLCMAGGAVVLIASLLFGGN